MKRDWNAMAQGILDAVGGPENISGMTHCATRLRLNLKDDAACDAAAVKEVEGVVNTLNKAGQYQVLIGTEVPKLYEKFEPLVKGSGVEISAATKDEGESIVSQVFSAISGIFAPLLPAMAGSGILRGFVILAAQLGIIAEGTGTYTILYTLAMSVFYFLPVPVGAARRVPALPGLHRPHGRRGQRRHDGLLRHPRGSHELQLHGYPCHLVCLGLLVPVQVAR